MIERLCPHCRTANPADNRYCGQCGSPMRYHELPPKTERAVGPAMDLLPDIDVKQVGRALAISAAALIAEAALLHLRRRLHSDAKRDTETRQVAPAVRRSGIGLVTGMVLMVAERQLVETENGRPVRRLIQRTVWRKELP